MLLKVILNVLKPSPNSLTLFAALTFICIGGVIQTYAFIDNVSGIPKPPLYDELSYFNLWFPWVLFVFPLHVIGGIFTELSLKELSFMVSGFIFTALVILIYTISIHGFLKALPLIQVKTKNTKQYEVFNLNG